ncbi:uncharacterized protein LACBIDRAFT_333738 [Laccaria bicolor S238N-H82]|uniref:Predicted protein n=1 Tax=Laccaria bicolor (strain S238N-H82 / ATCC MYA-4686) TaxID=486041 RepID=B0DWW6_LACBS|nr:uncharacterized protein LACBIDRAFT_333738 [Laccaria bicolor S238N-H82]EDR00882.1 predicted protein [Laccaria bicolor S238N-H82]|eukprot:XP_001888476.1 predicted protein [Laccaria bicolor S238N-H82]
MAFNSIQDAFTITLRTPLCRFSSRQTATEETHTQPLYTARPIYLDLKTCVYTNLIPEWLFVSTLGPMGEQNTPPCLRTPFLTFLDPQAVNQAITTSNDQASPEHPPQEDSTQSPALLPVEAVEESRPTVQALKSYLTMLDNHDHLQEGAVERGRLPAELNPTGGQAETIEGEPSDPLQVEHSPQVENEDTSKCPRSPGPDDGPESISSKRCIDPSRFPWIIQEEVDLAPLSLELRQTQTCLENFAWDPKFIVFESPVRSGF